MTSLRLPPLPTVRDIIKMYRLSAVKHLSQNFLLDERITDKIIKYTGKLRDANVLEVGPGPGSITRSIIRKCPRKLIVIEKDDRFKTSLNMLKEAFTEANGSMDIEFNDILNVNMNNLLANQEKKDWENESPNIYLVGNLPFNISTHLIVKWLHDISERRGAWSHGRVKMTLTFQKEVAERIVADIKSDQRCRLSVMAQAWTHPKLQFIIPGSKFVPKPDVDVGVVSFTPLKQPRTHHEFKFFEKVTRHMHSYRQKYCIACAGTLFPPECRKQLSLIMLKLADIDPQVPVFHLSVEEISRLASAYQYLCEKHPEIVNYNYIASKKVLGSKYTKSITIEEM